LGLFTIIRTSSLVGFKKGLPFEKNYTENWANWKEVLGKIPFNSGWKGRLLALTVQGKFLKGWINLFGRALDLFRLF